SYEKFRVRSLVGLVPLYAIERLGRHWVDQFKEFENNTIWFLQNKQNIVQNVAYTLERGGERTLVLAIVDPEQMKRLLSRVLDPDEFMSPHGLRSLSRFHAAQQFRLGDSTVAYEPAEAESKIKGGNSNWRGPVWFPTSFLMLESLRKLGTAYGPELTVPAPGDTGTPPLALREVAEDLANRMIRIFTRDTNGRRPVYGSIRKFQEDPYWRDLILFYEY